MSSLGQKEKKVFVNTFVYSNCNHGSLVWYFEKIEKI